MNNLLVCLYRASVLLTVLGMFSVLFFFVSSELSYEDVITFPKLINRFLNEFGAGWIFCSIALVLAALAMKFRKGQDRFDSSYYKTLVERITARHAGYRILRIAVAAIGSLCLVWYCAFVLHIVTYFGGFATAFLMDRHGHYEAAESLLCVVTTCCGSRSDVTVATVSKRGNPMLFEGGAAAREKQTERLNRCIAELYGEDSIQLAYRFSSLGDQYKKAAAESDTGSGDLNLFCQAQDWYEKSLEIYLANENRSGEIAKLYALMSVCAAARADNASAYENIGAALEELKKVEDDGNQKLVYTELGHAAQILGDRGDSTRYFTLAENFSKSQGQKRAPYRYLPQYLIVLLALPYLSVPLKLFVVGSVERNWQEMLAFVSDEEEYESLLDDLTVISLYQRKYEQGQHFSTELVGLAREME